jgi:hypothetical protein
MGRAQEISGSILLIWISRGLLMNSFYEHHKDSIRWHYRCFDRVLLNGLIQPFQRPERVVSTPIGKYTRSVGTRCAALPSSFKVG